MKKILKITGIVVVALFALLLILPFAFQGKIVTLFKSEANKMLNARVDFDKLSLSLIKNFPNASIELRDFSLSGVGEFEGDTLVRARTIGATVDLASIFGSGGIRVSRVLLDEPVVKAMVAADGSVNWDVMKPDANAAEEPESKSSFEINLKDVRIRRGEMAYLDDSSKMSFYTKNLDLRLKGDFTASASDLDFSLTTDGMYFYMGNIPYVSNAEVGVDMVLSADFDAGKYTFGKNTIRLNAVALTFDGWLAMLDDGFDMELKVSMPTLDFKNVLSLVPALYAKDFQQLAAAGKLTFSGEAQGKYTGTTFPKMDLRLEVADGMFKYPDLPRSLDNIRIAASVTNPGGTIDRTVIDVPRFSFTLAGNPFAVTLRVVTPESDPAFMATAQGTIDLGMVNQLYPLPDSIRLDGVLTADVSLAAKMSDIEKENYSQVRGEGNIDVKGMTIQPEGLPTVTISSARASVTPAALHLRELAMKIGSSDISAAGSVSNYLAYALKDETLTGTLSVNSNLLNLNELMGEDTTAGTDTTNLSTVEIPKNLRLSLSTDLRKVLFQKMVLENVSGRVEAADGILDMKQLRMNAMGGTMEANGTYNTSQPLSPRMGVTLNIKNASFGETFKQMDFIRILVPLFEKTGGNFSLDLTMNAPMNGNLTPDLTRLTAKGALSSSDIRLQDVRVFDIMSTLLKDDRFRKIEARDIRIPFSIENGLLSTSPFDLKIGTTNVHLEGTTNLAQEIDYKATVNLPHGAAGGYVSNVPVTIRGTFTSPKVELGVQQMATDAAKQLIQDQAKRITGSDTGLSQQIAEQTAKLRADAQAAADRLIAAAQEQGQKLVDAAANPLAKIAAQKSADVLVKQARTQAQKVLDAAETRIKNLEVGETTDVAPEP
ncbi:MAG: AsmA family protein [Rikenellaceae bacterium]|jgi:hypothetical protein|nr:AsmA family protein [Rikenellaceae bacterium]